MKAAILSNRGVVRVSGADAVDWLQNLVTNDIGKADEDRACFAALLTPQGKILFDFLIHRRGENFLLDCSADQAGALAKRLAMYRLRAAVQVDQEAASGVMAIWDTPERPGPQARRDPRHADLGFRLVRDGDTQADEIPVTASEADYLAHRIATGVPEGGTDFSFGDNFPHDANMDELDGVDFAKGCYIGQEVVSRVQHRGSARKRFRKLVFAGEPPHAGAEILAGGVQLGLVTSVAGHQGLGLVRIDRVAESAAPAKAGDAVVEIADRV